MEAGLINRKRENHHNHMNKSMVMITTKKKLRKKAKVVVSSSSSSSSIKYYSSTCTLQELFVSCKSLFKGPAPTKDVHNLCSILDKMRPEDVGLSKDLHFFNPSTAVKGTPRVTFTTMYHCDKFSLCIFFLPRNATIPLHNHPGMTVFSKLLLGKMHIKAYDWVDPADKDKDSDSDSSASSSKLRLAKLKADRVFTSPCNTSVLYPTSGGNIHAFTAITPCAVLDVIGPPYSKDDGRDCSYYKDHPYNGVTLPISEEEDGSYGWLEEVDVPEESEMDAIEYLGPKLIDRPS
ncbi:hypothetical protein ACFE04_028261 [Oxalis oulophora]